MKPSPVPTPPSATMSVAAACNLRAAAEQRIAAAINDEIFTLEQLIGIGVRVRLQEHERVVSSDPRSFRYSVSATLDAPL